VRAAASGRRSLLTLRTGRERPRLIGPPREAHGLGKRTEEEAALFLEHESYYRPFALRARGRVREERALPEEAAILRDLRASCLLRTRDHALSSELLESARFSLVPEVSGGEGTDKGSAPVELPPRELTEEWLARALDLSEPGTEARAYAALARALADPARHGEATSESYAIRGGAGRLRAPRLLRRGPHPRCDQSAALPGGS
jgi:hypothetical protein